MIMNRPSISSQKGVFAIEFALGFIVLFMFTMLIFETCRVTYIAAVLDYATAEAARDARVQLEKNKDYERFYGKDGKINCDDIPAGEDRELCKTIKSFNGDQFSIWFFSFVEKNGGVLWNILTSKGSMAISAKHYKTLDDLINDNQNSQWEKNTFSIFEVTYVYKPLFFKSSLLSSNITRQALVIDEFERMSDAK
ncbi:TadE/TadG family type IV pilus assembly protein [Photobacterium sanguinicancri]|uniref:Pilus assembly protein n=1 Tax=Photobacterium sanguinicancri TaxID=875932 RepID=A0AAW7Y8U1_9GAMM|nr:TadE family protein [Photobacterium sanguinicancri]MDO6543085.1 pilus assembly protein [Photobacterium sanguinicancri]